jgi:hypothetical protein
MKERQPAKKRGGAGKPARKPSGKSNAKSKGARLGPGQLDKLVLAYMSENKGEAPHTASAIGRGMARSSGAVANCLARLEKAKEVRLAQKKPRAYKLKGAR